MSAHRTDQRSAFTAQSIAELIRASIYEGRISPGDHLVEEDLATRFGVSRGPIREAIRLLVAEGAAVLERNRGAFVADPTIHDVLEVYAMRLSLGCLAFDYACRTACVSDRTLADLHLQLKRLGRASVRGRQLKMVLADLDFQTSLIRASGLERVTRFFENSALEIQLFVQTLHIPYSAENHDVIIERHERTLELLEDRDAGGLTELWTEHILRNVEEFTSYFPDRSADMLAHPLVESAVHTNRHTHG